MPAFINRQTAQNSHWHGSGIWRLILPGACLRATLPVASA